MTNMKKSSVFSLLIIYASIDLTGCLVHTLRAAIVGHKNNTYVDNYRAVANAVNTKRYQYCKLEIFSMEYDTTNGDTVYRSVTNAREAFSGDNVTVVIGPHINVFTSMSYVIQKQVHLLTSPTAGSDSSNRSLPIMPSPDSMAHAIARIVEKLGWKKVSFLSQDDFKPVATLSMLNITVVPIRLPSIVKSAKDRGLKQTLTNLRSSRVENIILHSMQRNLVNYTITAARRLSLLHHSIKWFVTYLDFENVIANVTEMSTIYGLQLLNSSKLPRTNGPLLEDQSQLVLGLTVDAVSILRHLMDQELNCSREPSLSSVISPMLIDEAVQRSDVISYEGALGRYAWIKAETFTGKLRTNYSIQVMQYKYEKVNYVEQRVVKQIGDCSFNGEEPKITTMDNDYLTNRNSKKLSDVLATEEFTVITKLEEPFVMKRGSEYIGFCVDLINELKRRMNFKIRRISTVDTWNDVIKQLIVGNASMAIGALAVTSKREQRISFSYTILSSSASMLSKLPPSSPTVFQFMWPFRWDLWAMIGAFFVIVGITLWLMSTYDITQHGSDQQFNLKESMWYSLNVLLQGGTDYSPQTTSMRTIVAFFWFCTLIIISAYTANLAAFLTLQQIDNRIKTVEKLSRQNDVKYGILNNSDIMNFFEKANVDPYARMWAVMKLNEQDRLLPDRETARKRVKAGNGDGGKTDFVFIDDFVINTYQAIQECDMESIEQTFGEKKYSMGFPKGAPYKDDINRAILEMKESAFLDDLRKKWWSVEEKCGSQNKKEDTQPSGVLDMENMLGVFLVLAGFVALSILVEITKRIYQLLHKNGNGKESEDDQAEKQPLDGTTPSDDSKDLELKIDNKVF